MAAMYAQDGRSLRHLGAGLRLSRDRGKRYAAVLVLDAHA